MNWNKKVGKVSLFLTNKQLDKCRPALLPQSHYNKVRNLPNGI